MLRSNFTPPQVAEILALQDQGEKIASIARKYQVSRQTIYSQIRRAHQFSEDPYSPFHKTGHTSKGDQRKWKIENIWYKADYMGYEGLAVRLAGFAETNKITHKLLKKYTYFYSRTSDFAWQNCVRFE